MKLLFVHERFGALGGAESNILATADALQRRGYVLGLAHGASTHKDEKIWLDTFPQRFALSPDSAQTDLLKALALFEPDAVYVHKMSDSSVVETLVNSGVPLVGMVHDHDLCCLKSYKYNFFTRQICGRALSPYCVFPCGGCVTRNQNGGLKWSSYSSKRMELQLYRQFHRLIVATHFMSDELLANGFDAERIEIHPPVPPTGESLLRANFSSRNFIIFVGQIIRGKGVDVLLESLKHVRVPFECLIFGDGNHRAHCEKLSSKLGLTDHIHFKGYVSPEELKHYYTECSVAVVSSVWPEPFGAVGLEAMRYGLPVVAFDAGGIKEWLSDGHNGYLVPWMDRVAFAGRVEELLRDKMLAREMGENGRHLVNEHFEFSKYINGLENLFRRVISERTQLIAA